MGQNDDKNPWKALIMGGIALAGLIALLWLADSLSAGALMDCPIRNDGCPIQMQEEDRTSQKQTGLLVRDYRRGYQASTRGYVIHT